MTVVTVQNNPEASQFEAWVDDQLSKIEYRIVGDQKIALVHTEVPEALSGQGIASQMAKFALEYARENKLTVLPYCPYIAAYLKRHPEYLDIVDKKFK